MRIYIASKVHHAPKWRAVRDRLRAQKSIHQIISRWIDKNTDDPEAEMPGAHEFFHGLWTECVEDARRCDRLIVYHEPGEALRGALVEAGVALAMGAEVVVVGNPDGTWMHHPLVKWAATVEEALTMEHWDP